MRALLAEYLVTDRCTMLFLVRADEEEPDVVEIALTREYLRRLVAEKFGPIGQMRTTNPAEWSEPLTPLVAPLADACAVDDLVWLVPSDVLHYMPMHALHVDGMSLAERNPVCYTPSASVMLYCRQKRHSVSGRAAVFADSRADRPLSHARDQGIAITNLYGPSGTLQAGTSVTGESIRKQLRHPLDVLHLACHGQFDQEEPMRSGILLAGDASLTAAEILSMSISANLVTLSACQSGVNAQRPGDELVGLTRALIYAGASAVLVSLWAVDEVSTSLLMQTFYQALVRGSGKATALRNAMNAVRSITLAEVVGYCHEALDRLSSVSANQVGPHARARLAEDIAAARFQARDFPGALYHYEHLLHTTSPSSPQYPALVRAAARSRTALRANSESAVDYGHRPFAHPYYWAPFILVGDWR